MKKQQNAKKPLLVTDVKQGNQSQKQKTINMKLNIKKELPNVAGLAIGGIATGYVNKFVPISNPKIKAAVPMVLGLLLSGQKGIAGNIGKGMIATGAANLAAGFGIGAVDSTVIGEVTMEDIEGIDSTMIGGVSNDTEAGYYSTNI